MAFTFVLTVATATPGLAGFKSEAVSLYLNIFSLMWLSRYSSKSPTFLLFILSEPGI